MKNENLRKILLSLGIFIVVSPFIIERLTKLDDDVNGLIVGIGIGLMIVGLAINKIRSTRA